MVRISLIIATYNRAEALIEALRSVVQQRLPAQAWECVVVNNNSTDHTEEAFASFAECHPDLSLRMVREPKQGLSHARNRGIAEAQGDYIAIIDDDERINPDFLAAYVDLFDHHPEAYSAGGRVIATYEESSRPRWMSRFTERPIANPMDFGDRVRPFPKGRIPAGGNMAFRREVFTQIGLFNPDLGRVGDRLIGGEESDLFARLSRAALPCYYQPRAVMWHLIPARKLTRSYFENLSRQIGVSQRLRAEQAGTCGRLRLAESLKWGATLLLATGYLCTLQPSKALYLLRMRWQISRGVFGKIE
ncbi:MAG: glycosyltransferase family 2 protein [Alistipes sp.]|nr:glycosyltransferase family 2 protein [Alistipes sp.]